MTEKDRSPETGGHPMLSTLTPQRAKKGKIVSAEEAVRVIRDGDTVATGGFVGIGFPEEIAIAIEEYHAECGKPAGLAVPAQFHAPLLALPGSARRSRRRAADNSPGNIRSSISRLTGPVGLSVEQS